jgi:hypothetical protein
MKVNLPVLGKVEVRADRKEENHWMWSGTFGWHDCNRNEDRICNEHMKKMLEQDALDEEQVGLPWNPFDD